MPKQLFYGDNTMSGWLTDYHGAVPEKVQAVSIDTAEQLLEMAIQGVVPDGSYSDTCCMVWSNFRQVLKGQHIEIKEV